MAKTGYINARVEKKLKKDAEKVLQQVGLRTSDAVSLFLRQVVIQQGLPFEACARSHVPNAATRRAIAALEAGKGKIYTGSTKDILDRIEKGL